MPTHSLGGACCSIITSSQRGCDSVHLPGGDGVQECRGPSLPLLGSGGERTQVTTEAGGRVWSRGHQPLVSVSLGPPVCRLPLVSSPGWDSARVGGPPSGGCSCPGLPPGPGGQVHCRGRSDRSGCPSTNPAGRSRWLCGPVVSGPCIPVSGPERAQACVGPVRRC